MSLADLCVCAGKLEKEIHCVTCKLFTSKLGKEFVSQKFMIKNAYMQVCMLLFCYNFLVFAKFWCHFQCVVIL